MPNLELKRKQNLSSFRKIALGTWRTTYDPTVYGSLSLCMDEALRYQKEFRERTGRRLTLNHMMARAVAAVLADMPDANAILRFDRVYLRQRIGVFFQVAMKDEETGEIDLSGTTVYDAQEKDLVQIIDEFEASVARVRAKKDENLEKSRSTFKRLPGFLMFTVLKLVGFLSFGLNLDLRRFGIPQDPFGSVMVTNIGSLGLEEAYVPLVPYSRVPLLIALGAVKRMPIVEEGDEIRIMSMMRVFATFDHRVLDGAHAARMSRILTAWFEQPYEHFGAIPTSTEADAEIAEA